MKSPIRMPGHWLVGPCLMLLGLISPEVAHAQIFVVNSGNGTVGEYNVNGTTLNAALITGLDSPMGIAVSGFDIFVTNLNASTGYYQVGEYTTSGNVVNASLVTETKTANPYDIVASGSYLYLANNGNNTISKYTTAGVLVNASLVSGPINPGIAVSGSDIFATNLYTTTISEYSTSGGVINASLVPGSFTLSVAPVGIAVSGSDMFVAIEATYGSGTIAEYTTSGGTVNTTLVSGLNYPSYLAISGSNLFVTNEHNGTVGEYSTSGTLMNASLISGLSSPFGIAVEDVPEPSTWVLILGGFGFLALRFLRMRKPIA